MSPKRIHLAKTLGIALLTIPAISRAAQPQKFLVFDYGIKPAWIEAHANQYVFVWGSDEKKAAYFKKYSPSTQLSTYLPYSRDPDPRNGLVKWKSLHPGWIAYKCNGTSPAFFVGDKNMPLAITNPNTIKWQISNFNSKAAPTKVVALDNFQFRNVWGACGSYNAAGDFVKKYNGSVYDTHYASDVADWINRVADALHKNGYKVIVNHIPDSAHFDKLPGANVNSSYVKKMIASIDGMVDEKTDYILKSKDVALSIFNLAHYMDKNRKWIYFIYQLDPLNDRTAESAMASYLMMANRKTAVYLSKAAKTYGHVPNYFGYDRAIGTACGSYENDNGLLTRRFTDGLAIFMLPGQSGQRIKLPTGYVSVTGTPVQGTISLGGGEGAVLYSRDSDACKPQPTGK